ncbi:MAG: hypothetical protein U0133_09645 [Gemmatimonadales bacterium]
MRRLLLLASLLLPAALPAQTLGTIDFPNSASPAGAAPFLRGVLLLHSFEYDDAAQAFRESQRADPGFALAYWGEAMTYTHPLWNEKDAGAARAALARLAPTAAARRARASTPRERLYLDAVEALYAEGTSKARQDTLYSEAMARILAAYPEDDEARSFYALSVMGLSQGVRNVAAYMRGGALAMEVYRRNPQHPGALHYIIHAFDDPVHAPLGLFAAREYSVIASDADHAQHMTTHIFLALGMWREVVSQNAIASGRDTSNWKPGHYTAWHNYGLIQLGQYDTARRFLELEQRNLGSGGSAGRQNALLTMRAHYLISTERWQDPVTAWALDLPLASAGPRIIDLYALAVAALHRGRLADAEAALPRMQRLATARATERGAEGSPKLPEILTTQLRAQLMWERGRKQEAIALVERVASAADAIPAEFGPPDIVKPSHELLGEMLLAAGQAARAQKEFARALEIVPGRSLSLRGLVRAATTAGDSAAAAAAQRQLDENWRDAEPGVPTP